ncbi:MAG: hypothetical protein AB1384_13305 [Actinomycetota bacterium]
MTREEINDLASLDPERFDEREHAALCWVRETLTLREGASAAALERFEEAFDERQRRHVIAAMKGMYFFNLAGNTMDGLLGHILGRQERAEACLITGD